jgi:hypothetical protein
VACFTAFSRVQLFVGIFRPTVGDVAVNTPWCLHGGFQRSDLIACAAGRQPTFCVCKLNRGLCFIASLDPRPQRSGSCVGGRALGCTPMPLRLIMHILLGVLAAFQASASITGNALHLQRVWQSRPRGMTSPRRGCAGSCRYNSPRPHPATRSARIMLHVLPPPGPRPGSFRAHHSLSEQQRPAGHALPSPA